VDQLASDAADAERQRIALDFHDQVINLISGSNGIGAIRQNLTGDADITHDIDCLLDLTR
jgi:hypothetical protein